MADELHDRAFGREVAAQHREPAGRLQRPVDRHDDLLARRLLRRRARSRRACGRRRSRASPSTRPRASASSRATSATPPARVEVGGDEAAARLEVGDDRRARGDPSKSSSSSGMPSSRAIASRCRTPFVEPPVAATAAIAFSIASRVMIVRRPHVAAHELASTSSPASLGGLGLRRVERRDRRSARPGGCRGTRAPATSCWP